MSYSVPGTLSSMIALKYIDIYWGKKKQNEKPNKIKPDQTNINPPPKQQQKNKKKPPHPNLPVSSKSGYNFNFSCSVCSSKPSKIHLVTFDCFLHFTAGPFWNNYVNKKIYNIILSYYATWSCPQSHVRSKRISTYEHLYVPFETCAWLPKLKEQLIGTLYVILRTYFTG